MKQINENQFIEVCESSQTMTEAARLLGMHFNTFVRYAKKLGCYRPNQGGKGIKGSPRVTRVPTQDILDGKYPNYETYKLKCRLIREGFKADKCELCGWDKKRFDEDEFTPCELHHKDGDNHNHQFSNLILLCPNCHSLTGNYRSKNRAADQK